MKKLKSKILKKVMPIFLLLILLFNFVMPNYVYGVDWDAFGGVLIQPIKQLVCAIADAVMNLLQNTFVTYKTGIEIDGSYEIRYSPGIIFHGDIPGLDINFISPGPNTTEYQHFSEWVKIKGVGKSNINGYIAWDDFKIAADKYLIDSGDGGLPESIKEMDYLTVWNGAEYQPIPGTQYRIHKWQAWYELFSAWEHFDLEKKNLSPAEDGSEGEWTSIQSDQGYPTIPLTPDQFNSKMKNQYFIDKDVITISGTNVYIFERPMAEAIIPYVWTLGDETTQYKLKFEDANYFPGRWCVELGGRDFFFSLETRELGKAAARENISVASQLRPLISKWYKATRLIAMVGLLSVLLYVGIKIILSSVAADKAKYKKMLMDWLTALCILFILHYIMVFILTIADKITGIFGADRMEVDVMMSSIRQSVRNDAGTASELFGYTIMYVSLVILTVIFTFQYLRRVLYMAFLTMIAPLIALTYPIDKVKDGQAQAFGMWIREYIFNSLIQPVHLLIYTMLVRSSISLTSISPIYAIVAISFIVPAEKFIRKMFGFEKASTVGQLGAAAGGAMIMNMINRAKNIGGKTSKGSEEESGAGASKGVRTPTNFTPLASLQGANPGSTSTSGGIGGVAKEGTKEAVKEGVAGAAKGGTKGAQKGAQIGTAIGGPLGTAIGGTVGAVGGTLGGATLGTAKGAVKGAVKGAKQTKKDRGMGRRILGAANSVGKKYKLWGKGAGRQWMGRAARTLGAGTLATIGIGAGVATGELGNVFKYGAAGAVAGDALGKGVVNRLGNGMDNLRDFGEAWNRGYLGEEEYANSQFEKKFYKGKDYKSLTQKYGREDSRRYAEAFLDAGITDTSKMDTALSAGFRPEDAVAYATIAKNCPASILHGDTSKFRDWLDKQDIHVDDNTAREYYNRIKLFT